MALERYRQKRNFSQTQEPFGSQKHTPSQQLQFVVQKHHASRLHYDFRLELGGILKSWAVPKGPSMNPAERRLAIMVEDHPFAYRTFEGTIPGGNYGAGEVIVWDNGTYEPYRQTADAEQTLSQELAAGELKIVLHGHKLRGRFVLVRDEQAGEQAWLLIKERDEYATVADVRSDTASVISGQTLPEDRAAGHSAPATPLPRMVKPMLATLVDAPFDDPGWLFEVKWDGYRAIGTWDGHQAELYSRSLTDFSVKYPDIYEALGRLPQPAVLDGEIVSLDEAGRAHFNWLQNYGNSARGQLAYYAFDLLWLNGHDLRGLPLVDRKSLLHELLKSNSIIRYSDHAEGSGTAFFAAAKQQGLEGIMAKRCDSRYHEGLRSEEWLKVKTALRQEVVIGGFTEPKGKRRHIGALLVGVYDGDRLRYVGHVGGGIPPAQLGPLRDELESLERPRSPFADKIVPNSPAHWVEPKLLCEVTFAEWTPERRLRQPIFVGLRRDKPAADVVREVPQPFTPHRLILTHRDKVFWPERGYTKGDLFDYYDAVSPMLLPYLLERPQSLNRQPDGITGKSFFQKDVTHSIPQWATTVDVHAASTNGTVRTLVCDSKDSLLLMVQLGCIEINSWQARVGSLDRPDWLLLDLDPEGVPFSTVITVAQGIHTLCEELAISSFVKTSGKSGMHVCVPLGAQYTYPQVQPFAALLATLINRRLPAITSIERTPSKRPQRVYIDYLQNAETKTMAAPFSIRPTPVASVSTPLHWDELTSSLQPDNFTIRTIQERLQQSEDAWRGVVGPGIDLRAMIRRLS